jgi:hypothetical protein
MAGKRDREEVEQLMANLVPALPALELLLTRANEKETRGSDELVQITDAIVRALQTLAPGRKLSTSLITSTSVATSAGGRPGAEKTRGKAVAPDETVAPAVHGFRQARFYLELAILCGRSWPTLPMDLADAASVLLRLFDLEPPLSATSEKSEPNGAAATRSPPI